MAADERFHPFVPKPMANESPITAGKGPGAYAVVTWLLTPLILAYFLFRSLREPDYRRRWGERFGIVTPVNEDANRPIVVHAASMGEVAAAAPLIRGLIRRMPAQPLLVTSTTPSGSRRIRALFGDAVTHCYLPLDLPGPVRRFLDRVRPRLLIVMETEIWPQLFHRAKAPIVIANGRLSHASSTRYRAIAGWIRGALRRVHTVGVQSGDDRERFIRLGARPEHVEVTGNLKFDFTIEPADAEASAELRAAWGADRPVVVAGSTRGVEAELLASAWGRVLKHFPDALLVMAPRHPDSFDRAFASARAAGLATVRMTSLAARGRPDQCLIIDTLGDLLRCYGAGDLAFVGGTLAAVGGHNPLEPAAFGRPVLLGPNTRNLGDIADRLIECGGAVRIDDADGFAEQVIRLLSSPVQARQAGERARAMVESGRGATARTLDLIDSVLETPAHRRSGGRQEVTRATD